MLSPASRQMSTRRVASATSVVPQARKRSPLPPKVPVPKLSAGTFKPEPPSCLYSIGCLSVELLLRCGDDGRHPCPDDKGWVNTSPPIPLIGGQVLKSAGKASFGNRASIAPRFGSNHGGRTSDSPSLTVSSSTPKPGPSVASSNSTPPGSRK